MIKANFAETGGPKTRKMLMQMFVGAIVGAGATYGLLKLIGDRGMEFDDPSRLLALAVGIIFALMGLVVGFGAMAPRPGAHMLNVEDADELREQRGPLWRGALLMLLLGVALLALALSAGDGGQGLLTASVAGTVTAICFAGVAALTFVGRNDHDELMSAVSNESMTMSMWATTVIFGIWGALAHLGYAGWIDPLGLLATLLAIQLLVMMLISAKRGLFRPR